MLLNNLTDKGAGYLKNLAFSHPCASHGLFSRLNDADLQPISPGQAVALLVNYDAHAGLLRRLLLKAAAYMPEAAVGYVLENVRNEYGNGDYSLCHQGQLRDVIDKVKRIGNLNGSADQIHLSKGVKRYIRQVVDYYHPHGESARSTRNGQDGGVSTSALQTGMSGATGLELRPGVSGASGFELQPAMYGPAITAGAITATELMAIEEFKAMQVAFRKFELDYHPWFDHVNVECDHGEESLALAEHFIEKYDAAASVEFGFNKTLEANMHLYDGLLEALTACEKETSGISGGDRAHGAGDRSAESRGDRANGEDYI